MKKNDVLIVLALLVSLFVYLFYRTEDTVINSIVISLVSCDNFIEWRKAISSYFPLNETIIYSLPEGLWVFCISLTSKVFYLKVASHEIHILLLPLVVSIGLELFQLLHLTNGRFDFWDIGVSILFWGLAVYFIKSESQSQNLFKPFTVQSGICILSYLIVYLAHVW